MVATESRIDRIGAAEARHGPVDSACRREAKASSNCAGRREDGSFEKVFFDPVERYDKSRPCHF